MDLLGLDGMSTALVALGILAILVLFSLCMPLARAVGAEYAGVDLLPADDGTVYVLEVNGIPGWHGLQEATSIDVAQAIVDHLLSAQPASR